jgi:hypothetical protein
MFEYIILERKFLFIENKKKRFFLLHFDKALKIDQDF